MPGADTLGSTQLAADKDNQSSPPQSNAAVAT